MQSLESLLTLKNSLDSEMYNIKHYRRAKEREVAALMTSLTQLKQIETDVHVAARRLPNAQKWVALTGLTGFYGTLMYCVWDVYSWDVMEPITYFIGFTAVLGNSFYSTITKKVRVAAHSFILRCCILRVDIIKDKVFLLPHCACRIQPTATYGRSGMLSACTC